MLILTDLYPSEMSTWCEIMSRNAAIGFEDASQHALRVIEAQREAQREIEEIRRLELRRAVARECSNLENRVSALSRKRRTWLKWALPVLAVIGAWLTYEQKPAATFAVLGVYAYVEVTYFSGRLLAMKQRLDLLRGQLA